MLSLPSIILLLFCAFLFIERIVIRRTVRTLPIRILVNGTRGKSSVTRYIAAALRAAGKRPFAKITGVIPTVIVPDGSASRLKRIGPARVHEQFKMLIKANRSGADSIVIECMSLIPENQEMESRIIQPTITVITNIREDHSEQMGVTEAERIIAMSHSIGSHTKVIMHERDRKEFLERDADRKQSSIEYVRQPSVDLDEYSSAVDENISIALHVSSLLGIDESIAYEAILNEIGTKESDIVEFGSGNRTIHFINCFAINDTPSAETALKYWTNKYPQIKKKALILNTRSDRPIRSKLFAQWCALHKADLWMVIVTGTHLPYAISALKKYGFPEENIRQWDSVRSLNAKEELIAMNTDDTLVIGLGNIAGDGFSILTAVGNKEWVYDH